MVVLRMVKKKEDRSCNVCRFFTGWDGGFFDLPMVTECIYYGITQNRKNCRHFKKRYPKIYVDDLLKSFQKWFNESACDCQGQRMRIDDDDIEEYLKIWR